MAQFGEVLISFRHTISRRKWIILYTFLAVFFATMYFTNQQSPVYLAQATLKLEETKPVGEALLRRGGRQRFNIDTEVELIKGLIEEEAIRNLAYKSERIAHQEVSRMTSRLAEGNVWVERIDDSNLIEVYAEAPTPEEAAELANTVVQIYIDVSLKRKLERIRSLRQSIERELITSRENLDESERILEKFKRREGNIALKKETFKNRLLALELKLSNLLQRYPEENPLVKDLRGRVESIQDQLKILAGEELEFGRLTRTFEYDRRTYENWQEQATAAQITEEGEMPNVSIVEPAVRPQHPVSPNKLLNGFVGAMLGLMIGVFFAFSIESMGASLRTVEAVEGFMKLPVLGVIPYLATKEEKGRFWRLTHYIKPGDSISRLKDQLIIRYHPQSPIVESYKSLRTNVQSMILEKGAKALLVTSSGPGEGKSITTTNLAIAAAQAGHKVLLVGGDLRRPTLYKLFGLEREPGLTDCLIGTRKWKDVLRTILDNLNMITCGQIVHNPAELLGSEQTKSLMEELKANFDLILFDTPPVLTVADATILGPELDRVILIYQTGKVTKGALNRAKEQLKSGGAEVAGIVLNNTAREMEAGTSYRYYRDKYYHEG